MDYINDLELCNSTFLVGVLLLISIGCNFISTNNDSEQHLELEMTSQDIIPVHDIETQTLPVIDEDQVYTQQMRNYMKKNSDLYVDTKKRKFSV